MKHGNVSPDSHKSILIKRPVQTPCAGAKQCKSNRHIYVAGALLVLSMCLQALCLLPELESSSANAAQVGVDARKHKKKKKKTGADKVNKGPSKPEPQISTATLVLRTDMDCRITIDGEYRAELYDQRTTEVGLKPGEHFVEATSLNGLYKWTATVQAAEQNRLPVNIQLRKRKAEAEETARIIEEESKKKAEAEAKTKREALDSLLRKGDDLYKAREFKGAIEAYKEALTIDANNDQAVGYIAYSYNKLHDNEQARKWMKRRVEIPGQSPSRNAQVLTDITLLYWDETHMDIAARLASGQKDIKPDVLSTTKKLLSEGIDTALKAIAIAPRSAKAFNLLNLLYRDSAVIEAGAAVKTDLIAKADAALRKSMQFFETIPEQHSDDLWVVPTLSAISGADVGQYVHFGAVTKKSSADIFKLVRDGSVVIEVVVGRDGKVRLPRTVAGKDKLGDVALGTARQLEFEPSTFEGHSVQVIRTIPPTKSTLSAVTLPAATVTEQSKREAAKYHKKGLEAFRERKYEAAADAQAQATKLDPYNALYYRNLGESLWYLARVDESANAYNEAIGLEANNAEGHAGLGLAYGALKKYDDALKECQYALRLDGNNFKAHEGMWSYYDQVLKDNNKALGEAERLVQINPNSSRARHHLGATYSKLGRYQDCINTFKEAIRLQPDFYSFYTWIVGSYLKMGKRDEAIKAADSLQKVSPVWAKKLHDQINQFDK